MPQHGLDELPSMVHDTILMLFRCTSLEVLKLKAAANMRERCVDYHVGVAHHVHTHRPLNHCVVPPRVSRLNADFEGHVFQ